jgi:hypothetical protein
MTGAALGCAKVINENLGTEWLAPPDLARKVEWHTCLVLKDDQVVGPKTTSRGEASQLSAWSYGRAAYNSSKSSNTTSTYLFSLSTSVRFPEACVATDPKV